MATKYQNQEVKRANISVTGSATTSVVAAVSGKKIRVLSFTLVATAAGNFNFENATTDITGIMALPINGILTVAYSPVGHFETSSNAALQITHTAAAQGFLTYVEV
jgi:hypothetical protein